MNDVAALEDDLEQARYFDNLSSARLSLPLCAPQVRCGADLGERSSAASLLHRLFAHRELLAVFVGICLVWSAPRALQPACAQVQTLFWAEGDGLPRPEIALLCGQLSALLDVMALETANLIGNYEQVRAAWQSQCRESAEAGTGFEP